MHTVGVSDPTAESHPLSPPWTARAKTVVAFALAYLLIDVALNTFAFTDAWTIIWPLNGVNVAILLMSPRSRWPWILLGIELGTGVGELVDNNHPLMEIAQRVCSATEVLVSAWLLPPFVTLDRWLRMPRIFVALFRLSDRGSCALRTDGGSAVPRRPGPGLSAGLQQLGDRRRIGPRRHHAAHPLAAHTADEGVVRAQVGAHAGPVVGGVRRNCTDLLGEPLFRCCSCSFHCCCWSTPCCRLRAPPSPSSGWCSSPFI